MDRISAANYATVGGKRVFQDLNLAANQPGTELPAVWHTGAQESIILPVEAAGLVPTDADNTQLLQAIFALPGKNVQVFSASGTFVVPASVRKVSVVVVGGGSGSSGCNASCFAGACGAGGGWAIKIVAVTPGQQIAVTVGPAGAGSAAAIISGVGGTSSFGPYCSATGAAAACVGDDFSGAYGGEGVGGDINGAGADGSDGSSTGTGNWAGVSGGSLFGGGKRTGSGGGRIGETPGAGGSAPYNGSVTGGSAGASGIVIVRW